MRLCHGLSFAVAGCECYLLLVSAVCTCASGKDSALQIKSVRVWQQEGAIDYRLGSQAVSSTSGSGSSYLPSGSAPPSSAPIYTPHSSPAAPHQPSRSKCRRTGIFRNAGD